MRKRLLLTAICALSIVMATAQNRTNPDVAEYYIKGYLSIERGNDGKPVYKLSDIQKRGISFDDPGMMMWGEKTTQEDVMFQFTHYATDYVGGITTPLDFWRYDETINEWQPDIETRQGNAGVQDKKSMMVMLVLDCSNSVKNDFGLEQEAAKDFIRRLLDASRGKGNVKIGVVCFSKISETEFYPISPLTTDSYYDMCRFINGRTPQNGTALYYAMDKAIDAMESYCNTHNLSNEPLSSAMMVTFTDGLDQTSRDEDRSIYTADDYKIELLRKLQYKKINGVPLQKKIVLVPGIDLITDAQRNKFFEIGESLGEAKRLSNMSELGQEFKYIAEGLINEWAVLNCFVPNSFKGRVAWTYPSRKQVVVEKPKELKGKGKFLFGINAGVGISHCNIAKNTYGHVYYIHNWNHHYEDYYTYYDDTKMAVNIGLDFAFPIGNMVNLGLFTSLGYDGAFNESVTFGGGPLMLINFKNTGSLYFGVGYNGAVILSSGDPGEGGEFRIGYKFKNGLYLFVEESVYYNDGYSYGEEYDSGQYHYDMINRYIVRGYRTLFHIGYSF